MLKNKTKKIIVIQRYRNFGGAEIQINYLKSRFKSLNDVLVYTIVLEDLSSIFFVGYFKLFLKICNLNTYDFLFFYQIYFYPLGLISKYVFRKKIIYSERIYSNKNIKRKFIYKYLLKEDLFIVNSMFTKKMYSDIKKNIVFLANRIPSISYKYLFKLKKPTRVALISRLSEEKNLIPTLKEFVNTKIDLVFNIYFTSHNDSYKNDLISFINESNLTINLMGKMSVEDIYSNNDLILHPSKFEGTSNVVLEAGYNRKPIIMNLIPQNSILDFHEYSYYNSPESLLKKINEFKEKKHDWSEITEFNYRSVQNYVLADDWHKIIAFCK